jgi:hypothetical protein
MKYHIKIGNEIVHSTDTMKDAYKIIAKMFNNGHENISLHGGRIGKWWLN